MEKRIVAILLVVSMFAALISGCGTSVTESSVPEASLSDWGMAATEQMSVAENVETEIPSVPEEFSVREEISVQEEVTVQEETSAQEKTPEQSVDVEEDADVVSGEDMPESATEDTAIVAENDEAVEEESMTTTQRNSLNMLNYITVLTQKINESKSSRLSLEEIKDSIKENIYPNAVDTKTQNQINNLWSTIDEYRMIDVKRERTEFIYEQNKAQAMREAVPDPMALLSVVQSGNTLKLAASVLYMAVDSVESYKSAASQADLDYLQNGWELDDAEEEALSDSQLGLFNYMIDVVRDNGFPGEYSLTEEMVADFVKWVGEDNLARRISWLENNKETYCEFRTYWLELGKSYYEAKKYSLCLDAIGQYEKVATRIFRKDYDFAKTLPMAVISAKEIMSESEYVDYADKYTAVILDNCDKDDWALQYFVAQIYIDLYSITNDKEYLESAYKIAHKNVVELVKEQENLNLAYLMEIDKVKPEDDATKREKQEIKDYNELIEEQRKVELPPVSEAFYLNCELMFALADELQISNDERAEIDAEIHEDGQSIFLTEALDNRFWARGNVSEINSGKIPVEFNGEKIVIPASCLTDRSGVKATLSDGTVLEDWEVKEVKRPKDSTDCSDFMVTLTSKTGKDHKYTSGEIITISIIPVADASEEVITFGYKVVAKKTLGFINSISFERVME